MNLWAEPQCNRQQCHPGPPCNVVEQFCEAAEVHVPAFGLPSWRPWKGKPTLLLLVLVREV